MDNISLLKQQYVMVRGSRNVVITFIDEHLPGQLHTPVPSFLNKSLAYLLAHNANVYLHWLANFAMQQGRRYIDEESRLLIEDIRSIYTDIDDVVDTFLIQYTGRLNEPITGITASGQVHQSIPLQVLTHVYTHEFHHKGQMLNMFRQLGHTPPDTDVIRS